MIPATAPINAPSTFIPEAAFEAAGLVEVPEDVAVALDRTLLMELRIGVVEVPVDAAELEETLAALEADDTIDDTSEFTEDNTDDIALPLEGAKI